MTDRYKTYCFAASCKVDSNNLPIFPADSVLELNLDLCYDLDVNTTINTGLSDYTPSIQTFNVLVYYDYTQDPKRCFSIINTGMTDGFGSILIGYFPLNMYVQDMWSQNLRQTWIDNGSIMLLDDFNIPNYLNNIIA